MGLPSFLLILYLEFFDVLALPCLASSERVCHALILGAGTPITPAEAAFLVVLIWMAAALMVHQMARPSVSSLRPLRGLVGDLAQERRWAELITFVTPYMRTLVRTCTRTTPIQRLHDTLASWSDTSDSGLRALLEPPTPRSKILSELRRRFAWLSRLFPRYSAEQEAAEDVVRVLYRDHNLRKFIVDMRPAFGAELLSLPLRERFDFADAFLGDLIAQPGSALYVEIERNQNLSGLRRYALPASNRILHTLFSDISVAKALGAWSPIGNDALRRLRPGYDDDYLRRLNRGAEDYDIERWRDPVALAIRYFDIMVTEAAFQSERYPMWLDYIVSIIEGLAQAYNPAGPGVDADAEFPSFGARLIYDAMDALGGWVKLIDDLPLNSPLRTVTPAPGRDDGRIPKVAAVALARSLRAVLSTDVLPEGFRDYMTQVAIRDVVGLSRNGDAGRLRKGLVELLRRGGDTLNYDHLYRIRASFARQDHVLRSDAADLAAALA